MTAPEAKNISVLCVDDNLFVCQSMEHRFRSEPGFTWAGAMTNATALEESVRAHKPDVVVLDIDMPGRSSLEALEALLRQLPDTRVVLYTAHVRKDLIDRALDAGAWGYVAKDEDLGELLAAVRKVAAGEFAMSAEVAACYARR